MPSNQYPYLKQSCVLFDNFSKNNHKNNQKASGNPEFLIFVPYVS